MTQPSASKQRDWTSEDVLRALKRASEKARQLAEQTGTRFVVRESATALLAKRNLVERKPGAWSDVPKADVDWVASIALSADPDLQKAPQALLRAAEKARQLAEQTGTPFVTRNPAAVAGTLSDDFPDDITDNDLGTDAPRRDLD